MILGVLERPELRTQLVYCTSQFGARRDIKRAQIQVGSINSNAFIRSIKRIKCGGGLSKFVVEARAVCERAWFRLCFSFAEQ